MSDIFLFNPLCYTTSMMCSVGSADRAPLTGPGCWETVVLTLGAVVCCRLPFWAWNITLASVKGQAGTRHTWEPSGSLLDVSSDGFYSETDQYHHTLQSLWLWSQRCVPSGFYQFNYNSIIDLLKHIFFCKMGHFLFELTLYVLI